MKFRTLSSATVHLINRHVSRVYYLLKMEFLLWFSVWEWDELRYINEKEWNRRNVVQKEEKMLQKYK